MSTKHGSGAGLLTAADLDGAQAPLTAADVAALGERERFVEITVLRLEHDSGALGAALVGRLLDEGRQEAALHVLDVVDPATAARLRADPRRAKA